MKKKIKSFSSDMTRFEHDVEVFMSENDIFDKDVINITQNEYFATLWYWKLS